MIQDEWKDAPEWAREILGGSADADNLKREFVKLRLRVAKLESYDDALAKRVHALEIHLSRERP